MNKQSKSNPREDKTTGRNAQRCSPEQHKLPDEDFLLHLCFFFIGSLQTKCITAIFWIEV